MRPAHPTLLAFAALSAAALPRSTEVERREPPPAASLADTLLFDESVDGALWVLGGTRYKARFAADGVTYYPFLGADAPRSESLHLELIAVTRGGQELELAPASPNRAGASVRVDRGALVEMYEPGLESMEQEFVLERSEGTGDLVLCLAVDTMLVGSRSEAGLRFEDERGGATYSRAFARDARGVETPVTTTWSDGRIELRVAARDIGAAELPIRIAPLIRTFGGATHDEPDYTRADVAYDAATNRFAVVWSRPFSASDRDAFMALHDLDGGYIGGTQLSVDIAVDGCSEPRCDAPVESMLGGSRDEPPASSSSGRSAALINRDWSITSEHRPFASARS